MRILSIHNGYQIRGGEDESCLSEQRLLRDRGHEVSVYEENNDRINTLSSAQLAIKTIWSQESYELVRNKLREKPYDLVHVQNFFPLISPSVFYAAKREKVPIVQTIRNYRLLCPNALFFRDGKVCEDCMGKPIPYPGVIHKCYRRSLGPSLMSATMLTVHRALGTWSRMVDLYITLTHFSRNKLIEGGVSPDKIVVKPNFIDPDPGIGEGTGDYAIYLGRISVEKGLDVLIDAWKQLSTPVPLKIVGDGPLAEPFAAETRSMPHIEWLGRKSMQEAYDLIGNAKFLIFPSKWYETFGRVAVEAFAKGTPVIASNIGAIAELIDHEETGLLFKPSNAKDLAQKVEWILEHPQILKTMRKRVRSEYEMKYTAQGNYQQLMTIYDRLLSNSRH